MEALKHESVEPTGSSDTFFQISKRGASIIKRLQNHLSQPHELRTMRQWRINDAARMAGISPSTLRKHETPSGLNVAAEPVKLGKPSYADNGQRAYSLSRVNDIRRIMGNYKAKPDHADPAIIATSIFKGGNHKTTTTVNLAGYAALLKGHRVLVIDLDPQGTLTTYYGYRPGFDYVDDDNATIINAMTEDPTAIKNAVVKTQWDNIDLIMADSRLEGLDLTLYNPDMNQQKSMGPVFNRLSMALEFVKSDYDVILLDCAPNAGSLTYNAVQAANIFLFPLKPDASSISSLTSFTHILHQVTQYTKPSHAYIRGFLTDIKKNEESVLMRSLIETLLNTSSGSLLLENVMIHSVELERATNDLSSVYEVTPRGDIQAYRRAINAFNRIGDELFGLIETMWGVR